MSVLEIVLTTISGWLFAAFGWIKWLHEIREKRLERVAKEKAENELKQIRRRADAPFLQLNRLRFNAIYYERGGGRICFVPFGSGMLLCEGRNEIEIKPDDEQLVLFLVNNVGEAARSVRIKLDGEPILLEREADMEHAHGFYFLVYPYNAAKHGVEQKLTMSFESSTGIQDTHVYSTRHGIRVLTRIDPPLPQ